MCAPVIQGYGLTETCAASFIGVPDDVVRQRRFMQHFFSSQVTTTCKARLGLHASSRMYGLQG